MQFNTQAWVLAQMNLICPPSAARRSNHSLEEILSEYIDITADHILKGLGETRDPELQNQGIIELDLAGIESKHLNRFVNSQGKKDRWLTTLRGLYPLYTVVKPADRIKKKRTQVKPHWDLIMTHFERTHQADYLTEKFDTDIKPLLDQGSEDVLLLNINTQGLRNGRAYYVKEMLKATEDRDKARLARYIQQCDAIQTQVCNTQDYFEAQALSQGLEYHRTDESGYYQTLAVVLKHSEFGRVYHKGISPQTMPRDIRRACVAPAWQLDIEASVFSFYVYLNRLLAKQNLDVNMPYTEALCKDRTSVREALARDCLGNLVLKPEVKIDIIKEALTAISFGARVTGAEFWQLPDTQGKPEYGHAALVDIIYNQTSREAFKTHDFIQNLTQEIQFLTQQVVQNYEALFGAEIPLACKTQSGRVSNSTLMSYVYQNFESKFMAELERVCEIAPEDILLRVHDAIYLRKPIQNQDLLHKFMRSYDFIFKIEAQKLEPYVRSTQDQIAHAQHLGQEEAEARQAFRPGFAVITEPKRIDINLETSLRELTALETAGISRQEVSGLAPDWGRRLDQAHKENVNRLVERLTRLHLNPGREDLEYMIQEMNTNKKLK